MEMIERYIYAATKNVPPSDRKDVSKKLRNVIDTELTKYVQEKEVTNNDIEKVLLELGPPNLVVKTYHRSKRYLISPELFELYASLLKIVLLSIFLAFSVILTIQIILDPSNLLKHSIDYITSLITTGVQGFAWVTIGFALLDYRKTSSKDIQKALHTNWRPQDLPLLPETKKQINRTEPIVGIVFSILFILLFLFANQFIGIFILQENATLMIIPFFNPETFAFYLPFIFLILGIGILKECLKLIIGKWTKRLALYNLLLNALSLSIVLLLVQFTNQPFWNTHFMTELAQSQSEAYETIKMIWNFPKQYALPIFISATLLDIGMGLYKAYKK
ncbi:hypothetical protein CN373_01625 [Bacillus cereus]|uniref:hypothetical protein n=1 Tax=Bacillus cereus TaxID=1396 RepID=UPI000BF63CB4|nr:hypothetical protein [Bacillus cereus]PFA25213.1 hypothetical protein CN373_01625 [Bacillus cereus]PGZ16705.1 hypothetical protein COE46_10690 [Bacillus cereus]